MKSLLKAACFSLLICGAGISVAAGGGSPGTVKISYVLHRIPKIASNQVAAWIEDESGIYVKTLFATRFSAQGGFKKRPHSLPEWVKASNWENASPAEVDAVSGATQKAGTIELTWDCTDRYGKPVAAGIYVYKIEGNIFWDNRVVWQGRIAVSGARNSSTAKPAYFPDDAAEQGSLIERVHAVFEPLR
jgi:hypothetical protein